MYIYIYIHVPDDLFLYHPTWIDRQTTHRAIAPNPFFGEAYVWTQTVYHVLRKDIVRHKYWATKMFGASMGTSAASQKHEKVTSTMGVTDVNGIANVIGDFYLSLLIYTDTGDQGDTIAIPTVYPLWKMGNI